MNLLHMKNPLKSLKNHFTLSVTLTMRILFFDAVIYGFMFKLTEGKIASSDKIESALEVEFYKDFCEVKDQLQLDTSM